MGKTAIFNWRHCFCYFRLTLTSSFSERFIYSLFIGLDLIKTFLLVLKLLLLCQLEVPPAKGTLVCYTYGAKQQYVLF